MAGFGLPNFGQLTEAFKKAKQIQQDAQKLQDELENMEIEGKSDDEMIKVWISGNQLPLKVEVQENFLNADKEKMEIPLEDDMEQLEDLVYWNLSFNITVFETLKSLNLDEVKFENLLYYFLS